MLEAIEGATPYPEVNSLLEELLASARTVLGSRFVGMILDGSLATGDFDEDSDIDVVVVTDGDVSDYEFLALQGMHDRIAAIDSWWATQLEVSYISQAGLRRYDPAHALHPNIERDRGQRLKMLQHDEGWIFHRCILREHGIALAGPAPQTLIDPVSPDDLRRAALTMLNGWFAGLLDNPAQIAQRGWQSYVVLSLCRILYTLQHGTVASKSAAARWAQATLDERWSLLIERTWEGRHHPEWEASPDDVNGTLEFIRYALERSL